MAWDELENLNSLPTITKITTEIADYLAAKVAQGEERKLFQFLNGLDKQYGAVRSNILMKETLPLVDDTVSLLLQEEMQNNNLGGARPQENSALMGKGEIGRDRCTHCGRDNHKSDQCWEIKGYPVGHPKHKTSNFKMGYKNAQGGIYRQQRTYQGVKQPNYKRPTDPHVKTDEDELIAATGAATQQLENLLKQVPVNNPRRKSDGESEEEIDCNFPGLF
ncbi:hypothetical protein RND81_14G155300 [Saponaria officinalis]|uniref:Polyprotein n=1 Tax=Saponaria officinalis TaxID=3572 RepID=A0AAW1GYA9_SAPOF